MLMLMNNPGVVTKHLYLYCCRKCCCKSLAAKQASDHSSAALVQHRGRTVVTLSYGQDLHKLAEMLRQEHWMFRHKLFRFSVCLSLARKAQTP